MAQETKNKESIDISNMSDEEKRKLILSMRRLGGKKGSQKRPTPTTDDELWDYIKEEYNYEIPRVSVCEDHTAPFDYVADYIFERYKSILVLGGRESAKTLNTSIAHCVNSEIKPGCESCTFANIEQQSNKSYTYVKSFLYIKDDNGKKVLKPSIEGEPLRKETRWKSGSKIEILIGTVSGVNSPHPQKVHADEVDLLEDAIWEEAQPKFIKIPTPFGEKEFGSLKLGDYVFDSNGLPTEIVKINEVGYKEVYEVEMTDGRKTKCCGDHLWRVGTKSGSAKRWEVRKTSSLKDLRKADPRGGYIYKYVVPHQGRSEYLNDYEVKIHPYVLGVLLGDGCLTGKCPSFRAKNIEIKERVEKYLPSEYSVKIREHGNKDDVSYAITNIYRTNRDNELVSSLEDMNLWGTNSHNKFIPKEYLEGSIYDRLEILRGLMDTDGSFTKDPYYASVSPDLARDVRQIVLSLGGRSLLRKKKTSKTSFANCGYIYEVSTNLPDNINPFAVFSKAIKFKPRKRALAPSIRSVKFLYKADCRCIGVEASDGLYLTEDFIVTHNSRNMASSKKLPDGSEIKAQNIATSTLKSTKGIMQKLMDESAKAEKLGLKPTWKVYKSCVYEIAQEVSCCRTAPQDKRESRLKELGKDTSELCECNKIVKGEWTENVPRTLDSVCKGKLFKSRGWMSYEDVTEKFVQNTPNKWASQLECRRPMADGLYLPTWSRERYVIKDYEPRPEFGYIWMGIDWGGSANSTSAILWVQGPLHQPVQVNNFQGTKTLIPKGSYVIFKEINEAAIGATRLADKVVRQEIQYRNRFGGAWRVKGRFADKAGAQQRADWREHNPPLRTNWYLSGKYFDPTVECLQALVGDSLLYADGTNCPGTCDDFESWRSVDGKEVHDQSSHNPAAARYCLKNVQGIVKRYQGNTRTTLQPMVSARDSAVVPTGALASVNSPADFSSERWRESAMGHNMQDRGGRQPWQP